MSQDSANFVSALSTALPGGAGPKVVAAVKDIIANGNKSKYAKFAVMPATVTNAPATAGGTIGNIACMLASLADEKPYTDFFSAQTVLTGKATQQDILSAPMTKVGGADLSRANGVMVTIKKLAASVSPNAGAAKTSAAAPDISKNLAPVANGQKVLKQGMKGNDVKDLQRLLNMLSPAGKVAEDGNFGPETFASVMAFQKTKGIGQDGKVGRQTLAAMFEQNATMSGVGGAGTGYQSNMGIIGNTPTSR
jgi:hypothetical protein